MTRTLSLYGGLTPRQIAADHVRRFVGDRCALGTTLVVPIRLLWREYQDWCRSEGEGWVPAPSELRRTLEEVPWASVEERGGRGRLRTVVLGVGVRPRPTTAPAGARPQ